jgi:hypothetical protein
MSTGSDDEEELNIQNMQLRNYFQNKIEEKEPTLIVKQKQGNIESYSRLCQSNERRQPVIVTKEQMEKIQKEYPEYNDEKNYIEYGTDPNKKYTYICPKYWNMKTNKPISQKEMNEKKLQKYIIPRNAKTVPANSYIYEFTNDKGVHYEYPNFIPGRHPDGYCIPCCFKDYDTKKRKQVREQCLKNGSAKEAAPPGKTRKQKPKLSAKTKKQSLALDMDEDEREGEETEDEEEEEEETEDEREGEEKETSTEYVKGPDKFPLDPGRWGYLPVGLQKLLEHDNTQCQISNTNYNLKTGHPCLLRHGIPYNPKQSFLQCIADVFERPSIEDLKVDIEDHLNLDVFLMMQNGNLVNDFYNDPKHVVSMENMKIYKTSNFYRKKISKKDRNYLDLFYKICVARDIFMDYLNSPTSEIDHTFMWDIVSSAYEVSLCIFEIPDDDITDNVEVLCPTNHYSKHLLSTQYDDTIIIVKKNNLYEPVYAYTKNAKGPPNIERIFSKKNPTVNSVIKILRRIEKFKQEKCKPINLYNMTPPVHIKTALDVLKPPNYNVIAQVVNYSGRVIGLMVQNKKKTTCFLPVQATGLLDRTRHEKQHVLYRQIIIATDPGIPIPYKDTLDFYRNLCKNTRGQIPCKFAFKVVEDELVVGFITETNQFVMIDPFVPLASTEDDNIPVLNELISTPEVDKTIMLMKDNEIDTKRKEYVENLKEESFQYSLFRNTVKYLLRNQSDLKDILWTMIRENYKEDIIKLLKDLSEEKIFFIDQEKLQVPLHELNIRNDEPIYLLNKDDNETKYYYKLADDLMRNTRLQRYLFSSIPIVVDKDNYDINEDEIILNESMILDYYNDLTPSVKKPNKYTSYDEAQPSIYKQFENIDHYNFYEKERLEKECVTSPTHSTFSGELTKIFSPEDNQLVRFSCSYGIIQSIIPVKTTAEELRMVLIQEYKKYEGYRDIILQILKIQGKKALLEEMRTKGYSLEKIILSTNYFLTTLDIWLLCQYYGVPCILLSNRKDVRSNLMESGYREKSFLLHGNPDDEFSFIVVPGTRLKKNSLRLMQKKNEGNILDSYFYEKGEMKDQSLVDMAFSTRIPVEVMLQEFEVVNRNRKADREEEEEVSSSDED